MTEKALSSAQREFLRDVRDWREVSGVSLREMSRKTMVNLETLTSFERTGHFSNPVFNRVYLRSLARAYATCVDLDALEMLTALDAVLNDAYDGSLGRLLRGEESGQEDTAVSAQDEAADEKADAGTDAEEGLVDRMEEPDAARSDMLVPMESTQAPRPTRNTARMPDYHARYRQRRRRSASNRGTLVAALVIAVLIVVILIVLYVTGNANGRSATVENGAPSAVPEQVMSPVIMPCDAPCAAGFPAAIVRT